MELAQNEEGIIRELSLPLVQSKGWMKLLGVLSIVYGILTALTLVGIVVAWLPIWMGVLLFQSASAIEEAQMAGNKEAMVRSLGKLKTYFTIMGVLMILTIIFTVIGFITGMAGAMMGMGQM